MKKRIVCISVRTITEKKQKMFEEILVRHCSPTLAGLKTGSMFVFKCGQESMLRNLLKDYNAKLSGRGVQVTVLRKNPSSVLIYVYRPDSLREDLQDDIAAQILSESGYPHQDPALCLVELRRRLREEDGFPHEIGLFLGYPPEDVRGFILHGGACSKCCGCWKVYGNVEESRRSFERFRKCRQIYYRQWTMGKSVEHLTVSA